MSDAPKRSRWRGPFGCLAAVVLVPLLSLTLCSVLGQAPSDAAMIREFDANQAEMDQLAAMILEEPRLTHIANDFVRFGGGQPSDEAQRRLLISDARWNAYRRLFKRLRLEGGVEKWGVGEVELNRWGEGMVTSASYKSFSRIPDPGSSVLSRTSKTAVEDLCRGRRKCDATKALGSGWYIAFSTK